MPLPSVLPTPEAAGPAPGQPGHFAHTDWLTGSVHALDSTGRQMAQAANAAALPTGVNPGTQVWQVDIGRIVRWDGTAWAPIAYPVYASSAGQVTGIAMSAGASGANVQTAVTFPVGRFTQTPRVSGSISNAPSGSTFAVGSIRTPSTTGAVVWIHNMSAGAATWSGLTFDWEAVQMTAASASG